jgi:hypothetical protein
VPELQKAAADRACGSEGRDAFLGVVESLERAFPQIATGRRYAATYQKSEEAAAFRNLKCGVPA